MFIALLSLTVSKIIAPLEEKSFLSWMRSTNQIYTGEEYHFRFGIFLANYRLVREFNSAKRTYKIGLNKFSCYTPSEYQVLLGHISTRTASNQRPKMNSIRDDVPESVDWREKNVVNEVKDQGNCGSCWSFGAVQASESAYAISYGQLNICSEQNLVDCVKSCGGCSGGYDEKALDYIIDTQNGFLMSESDYPYQAAVSSCRFDSSKGINQIKSYETGTVGDEEYLKKMIAKGVCSVSINAGYSSFQSYSGGIYDNPDCMGLILNHTVGLVGYGTENGIDYWIVRNSWGKSWGEDGYIRMRRNDNDQCGIAIKPFLVHA